MTLRAMIPRKPRHWLALMDEVRARWAVSGRRPFGGRVSVGYLWETPTAVSLTGTAAIAVELASRLTFMLKEGASVFIGQARIERADKSRLVLTIEGER